MMIMKQLEQFTVLLRAGALIYKLIELTKEKNAIN